MASKKIAISKKLFNNNPNPVTVNITVESEVVDGNVVAVSSETNPGVVYSNQK